MSRELTPQFIGRSFVKQYYDILSKAPAELYKFYNSDAQYVHAENNVESVSIQGADAIRAKIASLPFHGAHINLSNGTIDAMRYDGNHVLVVVTGLITFLHENPRFFTQCFVLIGKEGNSYFVGSSVCRIVSSNQPHPHQHVAVSAAPAPVHVAEAAPIAAAAAVPEPAPAPVETKPAVAVVAHEPKPEVAAVEVKEEVAHAVEHVKEKKEKKEKYNKKEKKQEAAVEKKVEEVAPVLATVSTTTKAVEVVEQHKPHAHAHVEAVPETKKPVVEEKKTESDHHNNSKNGPKSFADIIRNGAESAAENQQLPAAVPVIIKKKQQQHQQPAAATAPTTTSSVAEKTESSSPVTESKSNHTTTNKDQAQPRINKKIEEFSVYIASPLLKTATKEDLTPLFSKFGTVVGIDLLEDKDFGFVKFLTASEQQAALAAESVTSGEHVIHIQKRSAPKKEYGHIKDQKDKELTKPKFDNKKKNVNKGEKKFNASDN